jgi:hypothetical protein
MSAVLMLALVMVAQELFRSDVKPMFRAAVPMGVTVEMVGIFGLKLITT